MGIRLITLLLVLTVLLGGCNLSPKAPDPCSVGGLAQAALPALTPLPAWPFPAPASREEWVGTARYATLYEGTQARMILDDHRVALSGSVEKLLAGQPIRMVRQAGWRALWPAVGPCLAGRPVIRLGYSAANRREPPAVALLPFRQRAGEVRVPASALWIAPSRKKGEPTWIIATAMGPMDQRSLIYRQPNAGYTLDGPVTVMAVDSTEAARSLAVDLAGRLAQLGPTEAQAAAQSEAEAAAQAGEWRRAVDAYERLLALTEREAKEPGPPRPEMPFFAKEYQVVELSRPEVLLQMARANLAVGRTVYEAREALLHASYLAEEQGKQELLAEIRSAFREYLNKDSMWAEVYHRLAELEPGDPEHWWQLAEKCISVGGYEPEPSVAVAEAVGGADPRRAADVYLRQAEAAVSVSTLDFRPSKERERVDKATRLLEEALRRQPDHEYGLFLKGARESRLGNRDAALKLLEQVGGSAADHERAIAQGSPIKPVLVLDLSAKPNSLGERELKELYQSMGNWNYSARLPRPPAQQATWAPDGRWLATACTRFTAPETRAETDLCLVKVPEGTVYRVAAAAPDQMEWTDAGLLYSLREGGLWSVAPGGTPRQLAPLAHDIAVAPDGYQVAFTSGDGVWTVDLRQGNPRRLTTGKHSHPLWSPDGRELFFAAAVGEPSKTLAEQIIYRVSANGSAAPVEVGSRNMISPVWASIIGLRWWEPGKTLLVRHSPYDGSAEELGQATLLPLDGEPVTTGEQERYGYRHIPDRQRNVIWVEERSKLAPTRVGAGTTPPAVDLGSWPGFANPGLDLTVVAPGSGALAYTYSFGDGSYLFIVRQPGDPPAYLGPAELSVLGALSAEAGAVPLDWYRQRARPGWPISWSPDGRYLAWLKGDRLVLFALE